jgi:RNA polymerase sigma-70 factor (ECF subfamily)
MAGSAVGSQRYMRRDGMPGDESYVRLVERHRAELRAHCRRMLGSPDDAEDALQETLVRAWKGLPRFEGRGSLRSWLYRIATNTSLDAREKRADRIMPIDYRPPADPHGRAGDPVVGSARGEHDLPEALAIEDGYGTPEARCERRETIELAFIAALQLLPAKQRAVLLLREVLSFSARETADALDTTVASVNSALQRARATVEKRPPKRGQQETPRSLGDERLGKIVERYVNAWERNDVDAIVSMLAEDACPSTASSGIPTGPLHPPVARR